MIAMFRNRGPAQVRFVVLAYILIGLSMIAGLLSVGIYVVRENRQAHQREAERAALTADARYAACVGFNVEQQGDRNSDLNFALVSYGFLEAGDITKAERDALVATLESRLQDRYAQAEKQTALDNPFRDCSPSGIASYYENPPLDPAMTEDKP